MNWKTLLVTAALSGTALVGCDNGGSCTATATEICGNGVDENCNGMADDVCAPQTYVVSTIDASTVEGDETMGYGFDLDGMNGGMSGQPCTAALDLTSRVTGAPAVDNQLSTILPTLEMLADLDIATAIQEQIQGGSLLLVFQVEGIDNYTNDTSVDVHVALGEVMGGGTPTAAGTGLAAGQTFVESMSLGDVTGTIVAGRLSAQIASLPLAFDASGSTITLMLRNVRIGGAISTTGLTDGEFGAILSVDDLIAVGEVIMPGVVNRDLLESFSLPDIMPNDATGEHCDQISAGLGFTTVGATLD